MCAVIDGLEREWRDALCSKDMERLQSLVHKDFVLIGTRSTGPFMMTRDEWLEAIQRRDVFEIDIEIQDATVLPEVMIGTVYARWRLKYLGRLIEDCVVLTDHCRLPAEALLQAPSFGVYPSVSPGAAFGAGAYARSVPAVVKSTPLYWFE